MRKDLTCKIGGFSCKKSSKFEENSMINIYFLVPKIDYPVALCIGKGPQQNWQIIAEAASGFD